MLNEFPPKQSYKNHTGKYMVVFLLNVDLID